MNKPHKPWHGTCPACKEYLLVGQHSLTLDRERIRAEQLEKLTSCAAALVENWKSKTDAPLPKLLAELRTALDQYCGGQST